MNANMSYMQIFVETVVTFFALLLLTRFLGKKQLSHLTFFNYVTGITIGSIAANMVILSAKDYMKELLSLVTWCALTTLIGYISLKSSKIRVILDGQPTIIIKKGVIDKKALLHTRINIDDLTMLIRQQNVFSILEVDYAILEPNGTLSILKKPQYQGTQKSDLSIDAASQPFIPIEVITDGKILYKNLKEIGFNIEWLMNQLSNAGINSAEEVFYAEVQPNGQLFIQRRLR